MKIIRVLLAFVILFSHIPYVQASETSGFTDCYEDFEGYETSGITNATGYVELKSLSGALNGGNGWKNAWTEDKNLSETTIAGGHRFMRTTGSTDIDLYSYELGSSTLYRELLNPIDFSKPGEYYVKINAMPSMAVGSSNLSKHYLRFYFGEKLYFGTRYVSGLSNTGDNSDYFLHTGYGSDNESTGDCSYATAKYYTYVANISADGNGNNTISVRIYPKGNTEKDGSALTKSFNSTETISYFAIKDTQWATTRVSDIEIKEYDYSEIQSIKQLIADASHSQSAYEQAEKAIDELSGGTAADVLRMELSECKKEFISVLDSSFINREGQPIYDSANIDDSVIYDFKLQNPMNKTIEASVFLGAYADGRLTDIISSSASVEQGTTTEMLSLTLNDLSDAFKKCDSTKKDVRAYVWANGLLPFCESIDLYNTKERAVQPKSFVESHKDDEELTVAFLGDSITHMAGMYPKYVEYYYAIKYPDKKITFLNKGISGETGGGVVSRFSWDVLNDRYTKKPDMATLMVGMNDVMRSYYPDSGTQAQKDAAISTCISNVEKIINLCSENAIELTLITPPLYDENADYTTTASNTGVNNALGKIAKEVVRLANQHNLPYIDLYGYTNKINNAVRRTGYTGRVFNVDDRIHPTSAGAMLHCFVFMSEFGDDSQTSVNIDAKSGETEAINCKISEVNAEEGCISYSYLANSLPFAVSDTYRTVKEDFNIPIDEIFNREIIKVSGLSANDSYSVIFDDTYNLGSFTGKELGEGINIAQNEQNPAQAQSKDVFDVISRRADNESVYRNIAFVERWLINAGIDPEDEEARTAWINDYIAKNSNNYQNNKYRVDNYLEWKKNQATSYQTLRNLDDEAYSLAIPVTHTVKIVKN